MLIMPFGCLRFLRESCLLYAFSLGYLPSIFWTFSAKPIDFYLQDSNSFQIILQNYHLRRIRFHDLRHSCASLLLANGVPMKMIQEWLGHSDFSTTANIYSHLDYASKVSSAEAMLNGLGMGSNPENDT